MYFNNILTVFMVAAVLTTSGFPAVERKESPEERGGFFQGDIVLNPNIQGGAGLIGEAFRWPNATVVFAMDKNFTADEQLQILAATIEISGQTCIKFRHRTNEIAYVFLERGVPNSGCWSMLGRLGVVQLLNLEASGCITKGIIMHELLHAIGFYHEQSRPDRDDYVTINWDNIKLGEEGNFAKLPAHLYNLTYDYGSIMHYSRYSFAKDPSIPTIVPNDPDAVIGQRSALSQSDIDAVKAMYCPDD